jgi:hypothetical protein
VNPRLDRLVREYRLALGEAGTRSEAASLAIKMNDIAKASQALEAATRAVQRAAKAVARVGELCPPNGGGEP